jgi:ABC-type nickel/cobalt efflux system permease component RcnA
LTTRKTLWITSVCGLGHAGSMAIGAIGIGIGVSLHKLQWFEALRGDVAAWLLTGFGLAYMAWALRRPGARGRTTTSTRTPTAHHHHTHGHEGGHPHPHVDPARARSITPGRFVIFVLGPAAAHPAPDVPGLAAQLGASRSR